MGPLFVLSVLCSLALVCSAANDSIAPLSVPASGYWDGDDGLWSTFPVSIGSPPQTLRLLPSTSASAGNTIWVVLPEGCTLANPTTSLPWCRDDRGGFFARNQSSTWSTEHLNNNGLYGLTTVEEGLLGLGSDGNAYYGYDTVILGSPGTGSPTIGHQLVTGYATSDFWLGSIGLSPWPFNFSSFNDPQPSYLANLKNASQIPSLSWGYTAGAAYKNPPALGSLTLGGYDASRSLSNNVSFLFGQDLSRDLLLNLHSISYDTVGKAPLYADNGGISVFIDSMVTQLWLPLDICQAFERAFDLTWNDTAGLYLINDSVYDALQAQNPTFTFTLGNVGGSGDTVDIALPYATFDLNATRPFVDGIFPRRRYFPLKRAQNSTQYTLGRVFLQEAYIIADYERHNFSISQALFPASGQDIVAIKAPESGGNEVVRSSISKGAIAGIVVAALAMLVFAIATYYWLRRRRARRSEAARANEHSNIEKLDRVDDEHDLPAELNEEDAAIRELHGRSALPPELATIETHSMKFELHGRPFAHEMGGLEIAASELEATAR